MIKKAKPRKSAKPSKQRKGLARPLLDKMLRDLVDRLLEIEREAAAFATLIEPNGQHTHIEYQTRTACGVLLASLRSRIRQVETFARCLAPDEVQS